MKRQSFSAKIAFIAILIALAAIVFFSFVLAPLEKFLIGGLQSIFLGYETLSNSVVQSQPESEKPGSARVIMKRSDEYNSMLLINRGRVDGIIEGDLITGSSTIIGFAESVSARSSSVRTITSPFTSLEGVFVRSGISATFEGRGAGMLSTKLPQGVDIKLGDTVITQDETPLVIGRIVEVEEVVSQPFVTVTVLMEENIQTLTTVHYDI